MKKAAKLCISTIVIGGVFSVSGYCHDNQEQPQLESQQGQLLNNAEVMPVQRREIAHREKWTNYQDLQLKEYVSKNRNLYGEQVDWRYWKEDTVPGKTIEQCKKRYWRLTNGVGQKPRKLTPDEILTIKSYLRRGLKQGTKVNYTELEKELPGVSKIKLHTAVYFLKKELAKEDNQGRPQDENNRRLDEVISDIYSRGESPEGAGKDNQGQPQLESQQGQPLNNTVVMPVQRREISHRDKNWTKDEDDRLMEYVSDNMNQNNGRINWGNVANVIPGRTPEQCKKRYYNFQSKYQNTEGEYKEPIPVQPQLESQQLHVTAEEIQELIDQLK